MQPKESKKERKLTPVEEVVDKWNLIIDQVEALRTSWAEYTKLYGDNRGHIDRSFIQQFQLIVHRQTNFAFFLEFLERYVREGFEQLKIK